LIPTEWRFCVDPRKNFHREAVVQKEFTICQPGDALARFAFYVKPGVGETVTLRIPANTDGDVIPLEAATQPPFDPNAWVPAPHDRCKIARRGLAEQQERLGLAIEQRPPAADESWPARYIPALGIVVRPETHAVLVTKGSPADAAGIRVGDELTRINGIQLK